MRISQEHITKMNELFVTTRWKYIFQSPETKNWVTFNHFDHKNVKKFQDSMMRSHLKGHGAYGVFSAKDFTKFLTFDVDVRDRSMAKWTTYKLVETLKSVGINENDIHISISGSKGFHVDLYFNGMIKNDVIYDFYKMVLSESGLTIKEVEFRPDKLSYGVKLPLGIHQKTGNRCWYVNYDSGLTPIESFDYILSIEQMDVNVIYSIMERQNDLIDEDEAIEIEETRAAIESRITPLDSYRLNVDEKDTILSIEKLLHEGLRQVGTRNNTCFKIAKYFRFQGFEQDETLDMLNEWISQQEESTYSTKLEDCYKENKHIVKYIYDNEVSLTVESSKVEVTYEEMKQILKLKSLNQKTIAYCLLIHSKRFANRQGVFYMSFNQMVTASGLTDKTVRTIINQLEDSGILNIVARNQILTDSTGKFAGKKPNKYQMNIEVIETAIPSIELDVNEINYGQSFKVVLNSLFTLDELKDSLPRRQYEQVRLIS